MTAKKPAIVAPVMRHLGSADIPRTMAFYRDVVGFDVVGDKEIVYGPARLYFGDDDMDPYNTECKPRGSAIVFFQTDDVAAMHAAIKRRGAAPTDLEKVNWIKMQMFQIQDPDGHTLWFGQSYEQENPGRTGPGVRRALPMLPLDNVAAGAAARQCCGRHCALP